MSQVGEVLREGAKVSAVNRSSWASVMTSRQQTSNVHCIPAMSTPSQNPSTGAIRVMITFSNVDASLIVAFLAVSSRQRAAGECHCCSGPIKQVTFKYHLIHVLPFGIAGSVVQFNMVATGLKQIAAHILGLPAVNRFGDQSMFLPGLTATCAVWRCVCVSKHLRQERNERSPLPVLILSSACRSHRLRQGRSTLTAKTTAFNLWKDQQQAATSDSGAEPTTQVKPSTLFNSVVLRTSSPERNKTKCFYHGRKEP